MFESHNINSNKKKFQKPSILNKKTNIIKTPNVGKKNKTDIYESSSAESLITSSFILRPKSNGLEVDKPSKYKTNNTMHLVKKTVNRLKINHNEQLASIQETAPNVNTKNNVIFVNNCNNFEDHQSQSLNVESFLMDDNVRQNITICDADLLNKQMEGEGGQKWCLDFTQDTPKIIIEHYDNSQVNTFYLEQKPDVTSTMVPLAAVSSSHQDGDTPSGDFTLATASLGLSRAVEESNFQTMTITTLPISEDSVEIQEDYARLARTQASDVNPVFEESNILDSNIEQEEHFSSMPIVKKISMEQLTRRPVKFKCDAPDCKKEFLSEQKLKKHKSTHNKVTSPKAPRQTTVECPVKKILENGVEEPCGRIFHIRIDLIKHLNEEHTIDEAAYRCDECTRRFFWASGLRAHARAHSGAAREGRLLACPWPGCSRAFRQPCRLREHARAHTGDKPYSCRYPNCGWSFRTASKLLRHARRHTGDRRHACAACGRAFLRREHLRDHAARHHAPRHRCARNDCQQTFTNMSSLYMHMKKVHKEEEEENNPPTLIATIEEQAQTKVDSENLFMVSLLEPAQLEVEQEDSNLEGHSARTHCTWPLASRADRYQADAFVPEDDVQVEQSESSESNIYTVRSDLFLHGNVLHNDDSEPMGRCVRVEAEGDGALALDADLLLDAPSVHLDQEELYTDPVDESAFRVFLLSGEELT